jgi:hypothetical protein
MGFAMLEPAADVLPSPDAGRRISDEGGLFVPRIAVNPFGSIMTRSPPCPLMVGTMDDAAGQIGAAAPYRMLVALVSPGVVDRVPGFGKRFAHLDRTH